MNPNSMGGVDRTNIGETRLCACLMKLELPYKNSIVQKVDEVKQEMLSIEKYGAWEVDALMSIDWCDAWSLIMDLYISLSLSLCPVECIIMLWLSRPLTMYYWPVPFDSTAKFMLEKARNLQASERAYSTAQVYTYLLEGCDIVVLIPLFITHLSSSSSHTITESIIFYASSIYTSIIIIITTTTTRITGGDVIGIHFVE